MPFFGKKQDKEAEERMDALMARRRERKASCVASSSMPPSRAFSTEAEPSCTSQQTTSDPEHRVHSVAGDSRYHSSAAAAGRGGDGFHGDTRTNHKQEVAKQQATISKGQSGPALRVLDNNSKPATPDAGTRGHFKWSRRKDKTSQQQGQGQPHWSQDSSGGDDSNRPDHTLSINSTGTRPASPAGLADDNGLPGVASSASSAGRPGRKFSATGPTLNISQSSRLNVKLLDVLSQNAALPYFLQYAESVGCLPMVQFWMTVESFRVSSLRRLEKYRQPTGGAVTPLAAPSAMATASCILNVTRVTGSPADSQRNLATNQLYGTASSKHSTDSPSLSQLAAVATGNGMTSPPSSLAQAICGDASDFPPQHNSAMLEFKPELIPRQQSLSIQRDALAIYKQYISMQAKLPINIPIEVRQDIELGICQEDGFISPEVFTAAQKTVFDILDVHYYQSFLKSHFYCKFVIEILTSSTLRLSDIMLGDVSAMVFTEFMEQENALPLFHFWTLANSFQVDVKDQLARGTYVGPQALNDAMAIYDRYFSLQATSPLQLGDEIRVSVELSICAENSDGPQCDCFAWPMYRVYCILEQEYLPMFLSSSLHFNFLSKLVNSVSEHRRADQAGLSAPRPVVLPSTSAPARTPAGAADAVSITSLQGRAPVSGGMSRKSAHELLSAENVLSYFTDDAIGIDCGEDPDALWRRPKRPLNFARITELGQYVTDIEPYPDAKEIRVSLRARMSTVVQKMMNTYMEDSERQEMALRVARMVVTNIMRQTGQKDAWILQAGCYDAAQTTPEIGVAMIGSEVLDVL